MTDSSIPLDQLGYPADDGKRRDRWGRLLVVPPDGGRPEGYTRATTVAKTNNEGGGLIPWKSTLSVIGTMRRPGLRAQWESLMAAHTDPWYAGEEIKAKCKRLVEECAQAGGATDRRDQGIGLHAITAHVDLGRTPKFLSPETERDIEVYVNTLADAGITIAELWSGEPAVEFEVVLDSHKVAGGPDRILNVPGFELPLIADLKTGTELSYSWGDFAIQLAIYANADDIYVQHETDPDLDIRIPMPKVDRTHGLVIHLPAGEGRCELHLVDLVAGWEGFELSMAVRSWRQRRDLRLGTVTAALEASPPIRPATTLDIAETTTALRQWLQARIDVAGRHTPASRDDLLRSWPQDVPTLGAYDGHTAGQLAAIERLLDDVEARHGISFGPSKPGTDLTPTAGLERLLRAFPNTSKEQTQP